jgi:hypothetical protein
MTRRLLNSVSRRSASFLFLSLPFLFVITGLDPVIHAERGLVYPPAKLSKLQVGMGHRVKPGGDEK